MDRRDDTATMQKQPKQQKQHPVEEVCYDTEDDGTEAHGDPRTATSTNPGESSPTASAVSESSVGPTLVSALLQRHHDGTPHFYDLTPITRNSYQHSTDDLPSTTASRNCKNTRGGGTNAVLVSPPEDDGRDRLALPNNEEMALHHSMPPMRVTRAQSLTTKSDIDVPVFDGEEPLGESLSLRPVPLPPRTKFFSFTNREQYQDAATMTVVDHQRPHFYRQSYYRYEDETNTLRPYQPPRPEDAMEDLPPEEELSQIFAARRRFSEDKPHRLAPHQRMPSYERQESDGGNTLPSLHLAHRLSNNTDNNSINTQTTLNTLGEDDDDDYPVGGASRETSWSTLCLEPPQVRDPEAEGSPGHRRQSSETTQSVVLEGFLDDEIPLLQNGENNHEPEHHTDTDTIMAVDGRVLREQEALEWLQSLQLESSIAEAASSKFLRSAGTPSASPARKRSPVLQLGGP